MDNPSSLKTPFFERFTATRERSPGFCAAVVLMVATAIVVALLSAFLRF